MYFGGGLVPTYIVVRNIGLINRPIVICILGALSMFNIIIARTYFETNIPAGLQESAEIDGANQAQTFFRIILPLSKPIIAVLALYAFVGQWNSYFNALMYLNNAQYYPLQLVLRTILITAQSLQNSQTVVSIENLNEMAQQQKLADMINYGVIVVSTAPLLIIFPLMLRRNSPFWKAGALILAASMLMAGCGGDESSAPESSAPAEVTTDSDGREMVGNVYKEGLPIVKEPVTLTTVISTSVYVTGQVSEMEMWKIMEDETNIHIEIQEQIPSTDYTDKVNLMIQGGTVPDIFTNSIGEITSKYYNTGLFTLLDDLIEEWSPSYSKILEDPTIKANIMAVDGHIYATPFYEIAPWLDVTNELFVNTEWLDAVGMEMPTTLDEFYNVLVAFRDQDPNGNGLQDELPMVLRMKRGDNMLLPFFANFGLPIDQNYAILDGKWSSARGVPDRARLFPQALCRGPAGPGKPDSRHGGNAVQGQRHRPADGLLRSLLGRRLLLGGRHAGL